MSARVMYVNTSKGTAITLDTTPLHYLDSPRVLVLDADEDLAWFINNAEPGRDCITHEESSRWQVAWERIHAALDAAEGGGA